MYDDKVNTRVYIHSHLHDFYLIGNASQKAHYLNDRTGLDCFADDTGLEVKALGGAPGVHSAR
ncbi:non-canonical purine NTP pyrophosphatase, partial [Barnesiella intestinihominis]|uniref:non-canonical purine NTP pyrophosphatase n=1 Tax=Barnesiella intestinihominis TaxID=487174 RepID=UPI003AB20ED7